MIITLLLGFLLTDGQLNSMATNQHFVPSNVYTNEYRGYLPLASEREDEYYVRKKIVDGRQSMGVEISAHSAVIIDVDSGQLLFHKNGDSQGSIASMTKLMSALVFLDHQQGFDAVITLTAEDERPGAQAHIYRGEQVTARNALYASLMSSDNNSTIALARSTGLSLADFVGEMNKKALQLGLYDTHFADPTGLNDGNVSTPFDVSRLLNHALSYDIIKEITSQDSYVLRFVDNDKVRTIYNTDLLLTSYINEAFSIEGGKTGYIPEAGYCLGVQVGDDDGHSVVVVVMGSTSNEDRFKDVKALTQWAFDNHEWIRK